VRNTRQSILLWNIPSLLFYGNIPKAKMGVRQSLSGEVPDQQAITTSFLLDESYSMKDH